jgi:hypothetical protein
MPGNKMPGQLEPEQLKSDLILPKVVQGIMLTLLITYIIVCLIFGDQIQQPLPETQRVLIRTLLYIVAIATLPLTNLLRYIQLRLNQTMPYSNTAPRLEAKKRYLVTVIVSMSLIESVGIFGVVMFILGDNFNTLFIFSGIAALGLFLYRPKVNEYAAIVEALTTEKT